MNGVYSVKVRKPQSEHWLYSNPVRTSETKRPNTIRWHTDVDVNTQWQELHVEETSIESVTNDDSPSPRQSLQKKQKIIARPAFPRQGNC